MVVYRLYPTPGTDRVRTAFVGDWDPAHHWFWVAGFILDHTLHPGTNTLRVYVDACTVAQRTDSEFRLSPHSLFGRPILRAKFDPYWRYLRPYCSRPLELP